ncbi:hypothetical protein PCS_03339 [Desulfocurvibacter africanus PCS]|uniref:Uncharacterized protein n=1 Tax=Desulfocurvibacter africanus PCS TaxID=1262666 RepID=M5PZH2_DESAF|nr:hypothetical protein [Desulfocurvibacter africanus]EMG35856.1 hypothetical protein PCS_03339 [Desulfocurvibacter africanus PCS]
MSRKFIITFLACLALTLGGLAACDQGQKEGGTGTPAEQPGQPASPAAPGAEPAPGEPPPPPAEQPPPSGGGTSGGSSS